MTRYQPETKPCPLPPLLPSLLFFISLPSIKSSSSTRNRTSRWQSSSCFHRSNLSPLDRSIFVCREGIDRNLPLRPFDILATHLFEANNRYGFFLYFEFETKGFRIVSFKKELKFEDLFFLCELLIFFKINFFGFRYLLLNLSSRSMKLFLKRFPCRKIKDRKKRGNIYWKVFKLSQVYPRLDVDGGGSKRKQ